MAVARERARLRLAALLFLVGPSALAGCSSGDARMIANAGPERAAALAQAFALARGAPDRTLKDNDMTLGDVGLFYDAQHDVLYGRAWVNMARTREAPPERVEQYRRMLAALNDPHIGGMYERMGGYFVLDEKREGFFLVHPFPVPNTTPRRLENGMDQLQTIAAKWTTKWFLDVAMIMHGKEPAPTHPVTLEP